MIELIDKTVIFICCLAFCVIDAGYTASIVPITTLSLTFTSLNTYFDKRFIRLLTIPVYLFLCLFYPEFLVFSPVMLYDVFNTKEQFLAILTVIPLTIHFNLMTWTSIAVLLLLTAITCLLRYRTTSVDKLKKQYMLFRDASKEKAILMEKKTSELLEKQDYEINVATLNERNRIAREIHDNVGHMLSRCLLQLGALMAINKDEALKDNLSSIKDTLSSAMDSVRCSVHNLHDESIDLFTQIDGLVRDFTFCSINLDYDISGHPDTKLKYCFIAITKEALSNIIRHSNATEVSVALREHPALYQLIIQDNGTNTAYNPDNGIGLSNIEERVKAFNGNFHVNTENGFKIFISIPKDNSVR